MAAGRMLLRLADRGLDPEGQRDSGGPPLRVRTQAPDSMPYTRAFRTRALTAGLPLLGGDMGQPALGGGPAGLTLKSWTPMQANMNCRRVVTRTMFPMVRMATNTHCTTCCRGGSLVGTCPFSRPAQPSPGASSASLAPSQLVEDRKGSWGQSCPGSSPSPLCKGGGPSQCCLGQVWSQAWGPLPRGSLWAPLTFRPLALLMARSGRSTLRTLRIFTTEMVLDLGAACSAFPRPQLSASPPVCLAAP